MQFVSLGDYRVQQAKPNRPGLATHPAETFAGDFSLRKVVNLLPRYAPPPPGNFEAVSAWTQHYVLYLLQAATHIVGDLSLKRTPKGKSDFTLDVAIRRNGNSGYSQFEQAELQCTTDNLATPSAWIFDTKMAKKATDPAYLQSGRRRTATVTGSTLSIRDGFHFRKDSIKGAYANEWGLMEAVQRLPGDKTSPLAFTLVDDFDEPEPGHTLVFHTQEQVEFKTGPALLTSYLGVGPGIVPTVYWVDEHHRLIFVCTGLKVYALDTTNGHSVQCPPHYAPYGRVAGGVEE